MDSSILESYFLHFQSTFYQDVIDHFHFKVIWSLIAWVCSCLVVLSLIALYSSANIFPVVDCRFLWDKTCAFKNSCWLSFRIQASVLCPWSIDRGLPVSGKERAVLVLTVIPQRDRMMSCKTLRRPGIHSWLHHKFQDKSLNFTFFICKHRGQSRFES